MVNIRSDAQVTKETVPKKPTHIKVPKKKKIKYVPVEDSSDDEARSAMGTAQPTDIRSATLSGEEDDYQDPGPSRKRKANQLEAIRPTKKIMSFPLPDSAKNMAATKDKEWDIDQKTANPQIGKYRAYKSVEVLDLDSSDSSD